MIIATHLAIHYCSVLFCSPKNLRKHALVDAFLLYLHKNSIGHLLRTPWDYFRPLPTPPPPKDLVSCRCS